MIEKDEIKKMKKITHIWKRFCEEMETHPIRAETCRISQTGGSTETCLMKCIYWY